MDIFSRGTVDDMMERLCFTMSSLDSKWAEKIKPASLEQIQKLKSIINFPSNSEFPKSYLAFLETMGQDDGGLLEQEWDGFAEVNIDAISECSASYDGDYEMYPKHCLLFSCHWTEANLFLDLSGGANPPVLLYGKELFAATLENYLFQKAFRIMFEKQYMFHGGMGTSPQPVDTLLHKKSYNISTFAGTPKDRMTLAMDILKPYSLQSAWFSDEIRGCFFGTDMALLVDVHWGMSILIACNDEKLLQKMEEEICTHFEKCTKLVNYI